MVPGEARLFRWALLCVAALAAVAFNGAGDDVVVLDRAANGPTGKLIRSRLLGGQGGPMNKNENELSGRHYPSGGLGPPPSSVAAAAKSANVRRLILGQPSVGIVQRRPVEIPEQGAETQMVRPQQQQQQQHMGGGGNGQRVKPSDLTMGGCAATSGTEDHLLFRAELHTCGSTLKMTEASLLYTFSLAYEPTPIGATDHHQDKRRPGGDSMPLPKDHKCGTNNSASPVVVVVVVCSRKLLVSGPGVMPSWETHAAHLLAEQQLRFSLRLMTGKKLLQFPQSVLRGHHVPLRVYVDHCLATPEPDVHSQPAYHFISNHGCLTDAKLTGGRSYFMDRTRDDALQFQLQVFKFPRNPRTAMFITCYLRATTVAVAIDAEHKACSFLTEANRWVASGGDNQVCGCCETICTAQRTGRRRKKRSGPSSDADEEWVGEVSLRPILVTPAPAVAPEMLVGLPDVSGALSAPSSFLWQNLWPALEDSTPPSLVLCGLSVVVASLQVAVVTVIIVILCRRSQNSPRHLFTPVAAC
ncbi:hypothetical protein CRUP_030051 [Coryphaenoides rupestris]|nr:hypothetical protein CRUP_030051 [Coryphaenoides rupestris]